MKLFLQIKLFILLLITVGPIICKVQNKNVNEIHALILNGAGDGNRTHVISLEGWSSTIELHPHFVDN